MTTKLVPISYVSLISLLLLPLVVTVPVPIQMIFLSCLIILVSSLNSASRHLKPSATAPPRDLISRDQAIRFPIVASSALLGMFLAFKYLPKEWVSFLLTLYGVSFGALGLAGVLGRLIASHPRAPEILTKELGYPDYITFPISDLVGLIPATPVAVWYYRTKMWLPNNFLAASLALAAVDFLAIPDFQSAAVLLCGLFFYDVFWVFGSKSVFGSNVMVAVAKQFQGPIKLVFPRFVGAGPEDCSMLGLGDIVIPGLFVALMLRFDVRNLPKGSNISVKLPYFWAAMFSYFLGLVATYVALTVFEAAQPALLYLVPANLGAALVTAAVKGELKELFAYTEEEESDDPKSKLKSATETEQVPAEQVETKKDQ